MSVAAPVSVPAADPQPETRSEVKDTITSGQRRILRDPTLTAAQKEAAIIKLTAQGIDLAFDAGPFEAVDGPVIEAGLGRVWGFLKRLLQRDPDELRERAELARLQGDLPRAAALEEKAKEIEARRGNGGSPG
jgi:hypothetical protein